MDHISNSYSGASEVLELKSPVAASSMPHRGSSSEGTRDDGSPNRMEKPNAELTPAPRQSAAETRGGQERVRYRRTRPASQPAHLATSRCLDRLRSKTVEKIIAFAICLPNKIDASRFSGPEEFFAGAPLISLKEIERRADASIDRAARKLSKKS